jgi:nitroimidazol reductase NimA-like FMN-containing flavoprotein (pyridoxamine 5'-phosphate oxidase superfamily)
MQNGGFMSKQKKTKTQIKKDIIEFLSATSGQKDPKPGKHSCGIHHRNALVLATCSGSDPRATVVEFFNDGMTLYVFGEPGGKIKNIKRNKKVSAVVYEQPLDHGTFQKSLQLFGTAELITAQERPRLFWSKVRKWNMDNVAHKLMKHMLGHKELSDKEYERMLKRAIEMLNIIKITPEHVILKEWVPGFAMNRYDWKK